MSDRHEKWVPVSPGTVIPAGQPYRIEYAPGTSYILAHEFQNDLPITHDGTDATEWFVDSSWKPPLALPTKTSVILADVDTLCGPSLLFGPSLEGSWGTVGDIFFSPDRITGFEVLWTWEGSK